MRSFPKTTVPRLEVFCPGVGAPDWEGLKQMAGKPVRSYHLETMVEITFIGIPLLRWMVSKSEQAPRNESMGSHCLLIFAGESANAAATITREHAAFTLRRTRAADRFNGQTQAPNPPKPYTKVKTHPQKPQTPQTPPKTPQTLPFHPKKQPPSPSTIGLQPKAHHLRPASEVLVLAARIAPTFPMP